MDGHLRVLTSGGSLFVDAVCSVEHAGVCVGGVEGVLLDCLENGLGEEELADVGACAAAVVSGGRLGSPEVRCDVDVCGPAGVPTRENTGHGNDTIGVGLLKTTEEGLALLFC